MKRCTAIAYPIALAFLCSASCQPKVSKQPEQALSTAYPFQDKRIDSLWELIRKQDILFPGRLLKTSGKQCPQAWNKEYAQAIDSICAANIPTDARIWFAGPDNDPCWCSCGALDKLTQGQRDSLSASRLVQEIAVYAQRASKMVAPPPLNMDPKEVATDSILITANAQTSLPACNRAMHMLPFDGGCISVEELVERFKTLWPIFQESIDHGNPKKYTEMYPASAPVEWRGQTLLPEQKISILIPGGFYKNRKVGGELLAFMIAHEIGHAMADGFFCKPPSRSLACEGQCDWWAADRGLRAVFPRDQYVRVVEAARIQLAEYYDDVFAHPDYCGVATCSCTNFSCGYPPKACRQQTMANALRPTPRRPGCMDNWQPGHTAECAPYSACPPRP